MGNPSPCSFPNPDTPPFAANDLPLLPLEQLLELKLASGMTAPHRLRDLADVLELIRIRCLPRELADRLDPFVRAKYLAVWIDVHAQEVSLEAAPASVADAFATHAIGRGGATVLTSATLTTCGSFDYIRRQLGLADERVGAITLSSPF